ncbi:hypothetical protein [Clostridium thailandense]|uniref:hypothetical protein n=1 Tax=Clostridium thailandense TaxID=2794346 RepID=UPI003989FF1C
MFDISTVSKRYFEITINDLKLEVEPPKIKLLKKITALAKLTDGDDVDSLVGAVSMILSKNKTGFEVAQEVIEELDLDQMIEILTAYFKWLGEQKNSKN